LLWTGKYRIAQTVPDPSSASEAVAKVANKIAEAFPERPDGKYEPPEEAKPTVESKPPAAPPSTSSGDHKIFIVKYRHANHKHQETEQVSATSEKEAKEIILKKYDHIGVMSVTPK